MSRLPPLAVGFGAIPGREGALDLPNDIADLPNDSDSEDAKDEKSGFCGMASNEDNDS